MALVKYNNNSISDITSAASASSGAMTHIKTLTASSSSTLSFVDGSSSVVLDNTYPIYLFKFINIHGETDDKGLTVGFRDGSTAYDATKTTTGFYALHSEDDSSTSLAYNGDGDQAQSTSFLKLDGDYGADADQSLSGYMHLFNPSSTTFVKHFIAVTNSSRHVDQSSNYFTSGYCNVTAAIDGVQFKMSSGNIDSGTIKLYGIKDS
jgi:hypothetical protein